jgi:hypothetical protein
MPVSRFLAEHTSLELSELMALENLDPSGGMRQDIGAGIVAATVANVNRGKDSKVYSAAAFMPQFGKRPETLEEKRAKAAQKIKATMAAFRG